MPQDDPNGANLPEGLEPGAKPKDPPAAVDPPAPKVPGFVHQKPTDEQLARRYNHAPPQGNQAERYGEIREAVRVCAVAIRDRTPCSPEQTRAFNALDEAMFLANAAIARNEPRH